MSNTAKPRVSRGSALKSQEGIAKALKDLLTHYRQDVPARFSPAVYKAIATIEGANAWHSGRVRAEMGFAALADLFPSLHHGVEGFRSKPRGRDGNRARVEYWNMGDTYDLTLLLDTTDHPCVRLMDYGSWVEWREGKGYSFE